MTSYSISIDLNVMRILSENVQSPVLLRAAHHMFCQSRLSAGHILIELQIPIFSAWRCGVGGVIVDIVRIFHIGSKHINSCAYTVGILQISTYTRPPFHPSPSCFSQRRPLHGMDNIVIHCAIFLGSFVLWRLLRSFIVSTPLSKVPGPPGASPITGQSISLADVSLVSLLVKRPPGTNIW